jgi:hypothetical protein
MIDSQGMKICSHCHTPKRASLKFYHAEAKSPDKLQSQCKVCRKAKHKEVVAAVRREGLLQEEQDALDRLDRELAANIAVINNPTSKANPLRMSNIFINTTEPKKRKALEKQIDERLRGVRAAELNRQQQIALEQTKQLYPPIEELLT